MHIGNVVLRALKMIPIFCNEVLFNKRSCNCNLLGRVNIFRDITFKAAAFDNGMVELTGFRHGNGAGRLCAGLHHVHRLLQPPGAHAHQISHLRFIALWPGA